MITVIIVEDQKEINEELVEIINASDQTLLLNTFFTADEAIEDILNLQPNIVIMDINLPGKLNGINCIKKLREEGCTSQFLIFTIYEEDEDIFNALKAGANGYLLKKDSPQKIIEGIVQIYNGGSPMNFNIARKVINQFKEKNASIDLLTSKQNEVLQLLAKGFLYKEIADKMGISKGTVTQHIHNIYEKLHVTNKTEAINKYFGN